MIHECRPASTLIHHYLSQRSAGLSVTRTLPYRTCGFSAVLEISVLPNGGSISAGRHAPDSQIYQGPSWRYLNHPRQAPDLTLRALVRRSPFVCECLKNAYRGAFRHKGGRKRDQLKFSGPLPPTSRRNDRVEISDTHCLMHPILVKLHPFPCPEWPRQLPRERLGRRYQHRYVTVQTNQVQRRHT